MTVFDYDCRYPVAGIPTPTAERQDSCSYSQLRAKELSSRTAVVRAPPHQTNGPGPTPCSGLGEGSGVATCPLRRDAQHQRPEARTSPGGSGTSTCLPDPLSARASTPPRRGPELPRTPLLLARAQARVFRRKTRPPTALMREAEACSDATEHGAAFARLHYWSHIIKVHSAAAGAAYAVYVSLPH